MAKVSAADVFEKFKAQFPSKAVVERIALMDESLSEVMGGGMPLGRMVIYYSSEGVGKTTLALTNCLDFCRKDKIAVYLDFENAVSESLLDGIGLSPYLGKSFFLHQGMDTYEDFETVVNGYLSASNIGLVVVDSEAAIKPSMLNERSLEDPLPALKARLTSTLLLKYSSTFKKKNITTLWIQQMRTVLSFSGNSYDDCAGGNALQFYADLKLRFRAKKFHYSEEKGFYGVDVDVEVDKNKTAPRRKTSMCISYGNGFDPLLSIMKVFEKSEFVQQNGAFFNIDLKDGNPPTQVRGRPGLEKYIEANKAQIINSMKASGMV